jgi:hypothetical protein
MSLKKGISPDAPTAKGISTIKEITRRADVAGKSSLLGYRLPQSNPNQPRITARNPDLK